MFIQNQIRIGLFFLTILGYILYENIDQILPNKHEQMHYEIGVTSGYNEHVFYTLL